MQRIDGFYLYSTGYSIHPLAALKPEPMETWVIPLYLAESALETLLQRSVFQLQTSRASGFKLLAAIRTLTSDSQRVTDISAYEAFTITNALSEFEHHPDCRDGNDEHLLGHKEKGIRHK